MNLEVRPTDIDELEADERGRVTLGAEYGDKTVTVAILEVEEED